ncbi:hypothetical protein [Pseudonocardia sp.]|uniref:hypothetical protein n=1 Tax=Pseudonocardia sp. TaxID=60912 RepID=UPI00261DB585|nr:hypothetical protein [Pseudonocardia sp.]
MLARPALADVTLPATARFVDAFAAAIALRTENYPGRLGRGGVRPRCRRRGARLGGRGGRGGPDPGRALRPGERALLDQTLKLPATAESTPHEAERHAAYRRAPARLSELRRRTGWTLPRPATHALEYRARGVLTAAH